MQVTKRNGAPQAVSLDKILARVAGLSKDLYAVDPVLVAQKVVAGLYDLVPTSELDSLAASTCASLAISHPQYGELGGRLLASNHAKQCPPTFSAAMEKLRWGMEPAYSIFVDMYAGQLNAMIQHHRDMMYDYFGYSTLLKSYLLKDNEGRACETAQYLWLRVAVHLHRRESKESEPLKRIKETYDLMSLGFYTHASPTLFNSGLKRAGQLSSCFLLTTKEDSLAGIYDTVKNCALISKGGGGIGLHLGGVRAKGSLIRSTGGQSDGVVPLCKVLDATARYANQAGKRKGAIAVYLPVHHPDVFEWLELKKTTGSEELRARDLFLGLTVNDLFMERVENDGDWSLFCPDETGVGDLDAFYGKEFESRYTQAERLGLARRTVKARELWSAVCRSQIETGVPYVMYKDAVNAKSNQKNLGVIRCSNLCAEVVQFSSPAEHAVCNLASVALPKFVSQDRKSFDFELLRSCVRSVIRNLDTVIDITDYPTEEARRSNLLHRPVALGVNGLADTFALLRMPFESVEAQKLNAMIARELYYAALWASCELAQEKGAYKSFGGSPASQGLLQFDLWNKPQTDDRWSSLRQRIAKYGLRNSQLVAYMPTASTAQIQGNFESFEPPHSNVLVRRTLSGEHVVWNKHLVHELEERGLWNDQLRDKIVAGGGSVQNCDLPEDIRDIFKTVYEIPLRVQLHLAADRGPFVCGSQSLNLHMTGANERKLSSCHFYAWQLGLKTTYYLRTQAASKALGPADCAVCVA